jgi:hypothetical protein
MQGQASTGRLVVAGFGQTKTSVLPFPDIRVHGLHSSALCQGLTRTPGANA